MDSVVMVHRLLEVKGTSEIFTPGQKVFTQLP